MSYQVILVCSRIWYTHVYAKVGPRVYSKIGPHVHIEYWLLRYMLPSLVERVDTVAVNHSCSLVTSSKNRKIVT